MISNAVWMRIIPIVVIACAAGGSSCRLHAPGRSTSSTPVLRLQVAGAHARSSPGRTISFFAAALVTVLPLWTVRYLPFADLPEHLAVIATLRHWWDAAWDSSRRTRSRSRRANISPITIGALLAFPLGAELANRVLLSLVGIALPYAPRDAPCARQRSDCHPRVPASSGRMRPLIIGFLRTWRRFRSSRTRSRSSCASSARRPVRARDRDRLARGAHVLSPRDRLHGPRRRRVRARGRAFDVAWAAARSLFDTALVLAPSLSASCSGA